jgi:hypothetical protein
MSLKDLGITVRPGSPLDPHGTRDLEEAVIEAAKAFVAWDSPGGYRSMPDYSRLMLAVRTLKEAEKKP